MVEFDHPTPPPPNTANRNIYVPRAHIQNRRLQRRYDPHLARPVSSQDLAQTSTTGLSQRSSSQAVCVCVLCGRAGPWPGFSASAVSRSRYRLAVSRHHAALAGPLQPAPSQQLNPTVSRTPELLVRERESEANATAACVLVPAARGPQTTARARRRARTASRAVGRAWAVAAARWTQGAAPAPASAEAGRS